MAINKKLIHFKTFATFNSQKLSADENNKTYTVGVNGSVQTGNPDILYQSICYIKDTKQQWTHGQLYDCSHDSDQIEDLNNKLSTKVDGTYVNNRLQYYLPISTTPDNSIIFNDDEFTVNILHGSLELNEEEFTVNTSTGSLTLRDDGTGENTTLYLDDRTVLSVDENGVANKTALSVGGFSVVDKPYNYSIRMESYINYDDVAVKGFIGDLVGTVTISGTSYYKFDCRIANNADTSMEFLDENHVDYCPECFHQGYVYIPTSVDLYNINYIEAMMCPPIIIDGETVQLSSECYDIQITRSLPYSLRPTGTRCYINNERVATVNDIPDGIVTATNNRLNQDTLYLSGDNSNGYDVDTWWNVSIDESGVSMKHDRYNTETAITLADGQAHLSSGYPGVDYRRLDVDSSGIYEYYEHEGWDEDGYPSPSTTRERIVNESMLNSTITRALAETKEIEEIQYSHLRDKAARDELIPGRFYRITDYQSEHRNSTYMTDHTFDILIQALDTETLSSDAKAIAKDDDTYFKTSDLWKWELKYDIINDDLKYRWCNADIFRYVESAGYGDDISPRVYNWEPTYDIVTVNGKKLYLYDNPKLQDYISQYRIELYSGENVDYSDIILVTDTDDFAEDSYEHVTLYAMNRYTGDIYGRWPAVYSFSSENLAFGGNEESWKYDMIYTWDTININNVVYYVWDFYDSPDVDIHSSGMYSDIQRQSLIQYTGDCSSLRYALDQPLDFSYNYNQTKTESVTMVYDISTGNLYTKFYVNETIDNVYMFADGFIDYIDVLIYNPFQEVRGKGVIYYMKDDKGNEAPFDFKTLYTSPNFYLFGYQQDYSITAEQVKNNKIVPAIIDIPNICLDSKNLVNNTIYDRNQPFRSSSSFEKCVIYAPLKSSLTYPMNQDANFVNCVLDIESYYNCKGYFNDCNITTIGELPTITSSRRWYNTTLYLQDSLEVSGNYDVYNTNLVIKKPTTWNNTSQNASNAELLNVYNTDGTLITWKEGKQKICNFTGSKITPQSGVYYKQTTPTTSLYIDIDKDTCQDSIYYCEFTTSSSPLSLSIPAWLYWNNGQHPIVDINTTYLLTIIGDKASLVPFYPDPDSLKLLYTTTNKSNLSAISYYVPSCTLVSNTYSGSGSATFNKPITEVYLDTSYNAYNYVTSLSLPNSVTRIYGDCRTSAKLTDITLGNSVKSIEGRLTPNANGKIHIPSIDCWIPINCKSNTRYANQPLYVDGVAWSGHLNILEGTDRVGTYAFASYPGLSKVTIPKSVQTLGNKAFDSFSGDITLNSQTAVDTVGSAFTSSQIGTFTLSSMITALTQDSLKGLNINVLNLPNYIKNINPYAFRNSAINTLTIPSLYQITTVDQNGFTNCSINTLKLSDPNSWFKLQFATKEDNIITKVQNVVNSSGNPCTNFMCTISTIPQYSLYGYQAVNNVSFNNCVSVVGDYAFTSCSNLTTVSNLNNLKTIGKGAFSNCVNLNNVTLPATLTKISSAAFYNCQALTSIEFPRKVTAMGYNLCKNCVSLVEVKCRATIPPIISSNSDGTSTPFDNNAPGRKIYVPFGSEEAYRNAPVWCDYADDIVGFDSVALINFSIDGTTYTAEEGMTWNEWMSSDYKEDTWYYDDDNNYYYHEDYGHISREDCYGEDDCEVYPESADNMIIDGMDYICNWSY